MCILTNNPSDFFPRTGLLRMDAKTEPTKPKNNENVSEYSKVALQGGHKGTFIIKSVMLTFQVSYLESF